MQRRAYAAVTALTVASCAPYASEISPAAISDARYDGWSCEKLEKERSFVDQALVRVSGDQDHAAQHDALIVALIGVPTSNGGVKEQVADLKGQQIALHEAELAANCPHQ